MMERRKKWALIFNVAIFYLALIGCEMCFCNIVIIPTTSHAEGIELLKFFTLQSNIFAGITALIYVIFLLVNRKKKKEIPMLIHILRFIATIDLVITFLVVALFLGFIAEDGYFSLYLNANFLFHFLIPILNFVSFTFFEKKPRFEFRHIFAGLTHFFLYTVFYLTTVLVHFKDGAVDLKYDWYAFAHFGLGIAFICAVIVFSLGFLVAYLIYRIVNKRNDLFDNKNETV